MVGGHWYVVGCYRAGKTRANWRIYLENEKVGGRVSIVNTAAPFRKNEQIRWNSLHVSARQSMREQVLFIWKKRTSPKSSRRCPCLSLRSEACSPLCRAGGSWIFGYVPCLYLPRDPQADIINILSGRVEFKPLLLTGCGAGTTSHSWMGSILRILVPIRRAP